jgi:hypothetical protein
MANPSTVNPTASGKEVLRRAFFDGAGEAGNIILTAPTNHICTIVSIVLLERADLSDVTFNLFIAPDGGSALYLLINQDIPAYGTFIFSDKIVLTGGDVLKLQPASVGSTADCDIWVSYIDQDWTT